ncbi:MAG: nitroreductase family protein [Saccharofermentanales bacterium]
MDFNELALSRRSIRSFLDKPVSNDLITKLLEAAQAAPSGGNCQPWHFYVIKDKSFVSKICEKAIRQDFIKSASVVIVVCADISKTIERYGARGKDLYCIQDTAAAIQNILLCAASNGLGTCWCGAFDEETLAEVMHLDSDLRPVAIIPVGYYESAPAMPRRRPLSEIVTYIGE